MITFYGGVFTPSELHRSARCLFRRAASVNAALAAIRQGESLHLQYVVGRPVWSLSSGRSVSPKVAEILTSNASITPADGALFDCVPAQLWRFTDDR